ncbi:MAG: adenosine kinase [Pseudomonadota bacterium]
MSEPTHDVLGIGNAIVDVISRTTDDFLDEHGIAKGGMHLIDEARAESLYAQTGPAIEMSGGSAANTIAGVGSFGGKGAYIGKVRDDQLGQVFSHDIKAIGVTFETPLAGDGPSTARSLILVSPDGERTMNTYLGACVHLGPGDLDADLIASAKVTYLEGYLWDPEAAKEAFRSAAKIAAEAGRKVSLTLSDPFCVDRHREGFLELTKNSVDILFANEVEIMSLYQVDSFEDAAAAVAQDCELTVITRSEKGCVVVTPDQQIAVPAVPVEKVVDTTGAGDMFAAGFLYGYTNGRNLETCGRLGVLAASEIISHVGARPETPFTELAAAHGLD